MTKNYNNNLVEPLLMVDSTDSNQFASYISLNQLHKAPFHTDSEQWLIVFCLVFYFYLALNTKMLKEENKVFERR